MKSPALLLQLCLIFAANLLNTQAAETLNFNPDWLFLREDPVGASEVEFDDGGWRRVSIPHTYNDSDTFDDWSPPGHKGEMDQWGGKTWYRKHFDLPADWEGRKIIIEFEAVRQIAEIFCNGVKVGRCENGFIPFGADLTPHLNFGANNVIAVSCDNSFVKDTDFGGNRTKVWHEFQGGAKLPWNNPHWHPAHGGIYRNVMLHVSDPLHFTQPLFNNMETVGTYVYALNPSREKTGVGVENEIANDSARAQSFTLRNQLLDRGGRVVWELSQSARLGSDERRVFKAQGEFADPELWEPAYPYLYELVSEILRDGTVIDRNREPFGVRWVELTTDRGFFINDRYVKLQGWGIKSVDGWPGLGAANPDWMHYHTLQLVSKAGGNFVRWGHTAGAPIHLTAADRLGIITQQPGVDGEGDTDGHAWAIRAKAWKEAVIYFRNHPSLVVWEGGNQSTSEPHTRELKNTVLRFDPHGGRVYGHRRANQTVKPFCDLTISTEGSGYIRSLPTIEGEYNREESPRRVWDRHTPPYQDWHASGSYDLSAEEFALNQLIHYNKIAAPGHCGGANWIFVDSTSGGRVDSEVTRTSGELDAMRLPKEAYHVCRVIFTDEPDLHLLGHWNYPQGTRKDVHVAADCEEVALVLNGKEIGRKQAVAGVKVLRQSAKKGSANRGPAAWQHPMRFTFPDIDWQAGRLTAIGYVGGREVDRQTLETSGPAAALRLTPLTGPEGLLANGSDAVVFDVEALDARGRRCPTFNGRCNFSLRGPGEWRGGYNSGQIDSTNHTHLELESGINRVIVRSTREPGTLELTATSKGLKGATCRVRSHPFPTTRGLSRKLPPIPEQPGLTRPEPPADDEGPGPAVRQIVDNMDSDLIGDLSYSGPSGGARVEKTRPGGPMFSDHAQKLPPKLPNSLRGGETILLPNQDWNYSAVDLLQFNVKKNAKVYIAHDIRLEPLPWLKQGFTDTGEILTEGKHRWRIHARKVAANQSVLLGSNTEADGEKRWMMAVFVVPN